MEDDSLFKLTLLSNKVVDELCNHGGLMVERTLELVPDNVQVRVGLVVELRDDRDQQVEQDDAHEEDLYQPKEPDPVQHDVPNL